MDAGAVAVARNSRQPVIVRCRQLVAQQLVQLASAESCGAGVNRIYLLQLVEIAMSSCKAS